MPNVVFVAPFMMEATARFLQAAAVLPGVRLGLVTQEPVERIPAGLRGRLAAHWQVTNALDAGELVRAGQGLGVQLGPLHRMLGVLEPLQVPLAEARERLGISGMGVEAARNFRDKARMKTVLHAHGVPCARHGLAGDAEEARAFARQTGLPLVVKPPDGAGAKGTFRVETTEQLEEALRLSRPTPAHPLLLEEFIRGEEHSFDSVFIGGRPVWYSISDYQPTPLEVLENPWIQWCILLPRELDRPEYHEVRDVALKAVRVLGMETGLSHMEWFRRPDGSLAISEVGARPPGAQIVSLISYVHEIDLYAAWARLMVFDQFEPRQRKFAAGAAFLRGQGQGRVVAVHGLEQAQREVGEVVVEARLPRAGQSPSSSYEGEGYVIVRHPDTDVVRRALSRVISLIRVELGPA